MRRWIALILDIALLRFGRVMFSVCFNGDPAKILPAIDELRHLWMTSQIFGEMQRISGPTIV